MGTIFYGGRPILLDDDVKQSLEGLKMSINGGYAKVYKDGQSQKLHRIVIGAKDGQIVDHINGNSLDNRRSNLRIVTHAQNMANRSCNTTSASKLKGVTYDTSMIRKKRWAASIHHQGKRIKIGRYFTKEEAAMAYDEMASRLKGQYARLNFGRIAS